MKIFFKSNKTNDITTRICIKCKNKVSDTYYEEEEDGVRMFVCTKCHNNSLRVRE